MLRIYNTFSNKKESFVPLDPSHIKLYVCGPTVYNEIHVGNARTLIVFDLLYKILQKEYSKVTYVRNITDIDDKIIKKAQEENCTSADIAQKWEASFHENCIKLGLQSPTYEPRATDTIPEIIQSISELINAGFAYVKDDEVFFRISNLTQYGQLSKQINTCAGKRIKISIEKEDAKDFTLWKGSKTNEPFWPSPWGNGRPGWHIECTAMSMKFLGEQFDIHGGGQDLIFPHHENELAQDIGICGAHAGPKYWMHNAMILFGGQKMSKSLGNIVLLSQAFQQFNPAFIKFFTLSTHYRHQLLWDNELLMQALARWQKWVNKLEYAESDWNFPTEIYEQLLNDINTPGAFAEIDKMLASTDQKLHNKLRGLLSWLGLMPLEEQIPDLVLQKAQQRITARAQKDFVLSDQLRTEIEALGYVILDTDQGQKIKKLY